MNPKIWDYDWEQKNIMKTISFVIPVYNEAKRLGKTFKALRELQLPHGLKLQEIIFVNDGSTDKTKSDIRKLLKANIKLISYKQNKGKGYAVKQGMLASTADYTLLLDADMSTPFSELTKFIPFIKRDIDVIVGTRKNGHSTVIKHQPIIRELLGIGFTKLTRLLLGLNGTDFTCGFKAFSKKAVASIFPNSIINRWAYDAEILLLAQKQHLTIVEKSVLWTNDEATKVAIPTAILQTLYELVTIVYTHTITPALYALAKLTKVEYSYKRITSSFL